MIEAQGRDAAEGSQRKKAQAARVTAVCGNVQRALEGREEVFGDALAGHVLEIEIAAARAMYEENVLRRHQPGKETDAASAAAPGTQAEETPETVFHAAALRAAARPAMAIRTKQVA